MKSTAHGRTGIVPALHGWKLCPCGCQKLPFADESYCVDVKYYCSSRMEVTAPGQTRTLLHGCEIALRG